MRSLLMLLIAGLALSGCATGVMSEQECLAGDWYGAGLEDGARGRTESAFDERAARCAGFGAPPPDGGAYIEGRNAGLFRLCTDAGGYDYGLSGRVYQGVCRPEREFAFLGGYLSGQRIHRFETRRNAAASELRSAEAYLDSLWRTIRKARKTINDEEATEEDVEKARKRRKEARESIPYAERRVDDALYALGRADEALAGALATRREWREGFAFEAARAKLSAVHGVARGETAIDFCTDDRDALGAACDVRAGAFVTDDATGQRCAVGPGRAVLADYRRREDGDAVEDWLRFDYFEARSSTLRELFAGREPISEFEAIVRDGALSRISCPFGVFPQTG